MAKKETEVQQKAAELQGAILPALSKEEVKDICQRAAFALGFIAPMTKTKIDDKGAVLLAKIAQDGNLLDNIFDLVQDALAEQSAE